MSIDNIIPKSEGYITPEQYWAVVSEFGDVLTPLMDGKVDIQDAILAATELLGAFSAVRAIPPEHRAKVIASVLIYFGSKVAVDLVVIHPEEQ